MENKIGNIIIEESEDRFKKVNIGIINDKDIDCLTLGLYVKILTLGKTWKLYIKGLSSILGVSDNKIRKSISLLEKKGYVTRHSIKNDEGKFEGWNYHFYSESIEEQDRTCAGKRTLQKTDTPKDGDDRKRTTPKTDNTETWQDNNNRINTTIDLNKEKIEECNWRNDFNTYLTLVLNAKDELLHNVDFFAQMQKFYPNADYRMTLDKMVEMYWGTEQGWENKKKKRTKDINMVTTLKRNFDKNIVYLQRGCFNPPVYSKKENTKNNIKPNNGNLFIDGVEYK